MTKDDNGNLIIDGVKIEISEPVITSTSVYRGIKARILYKVSMSQK